MLPVMVETIAAALKLPYVSLQLENGGRYVDGASIGQLRGAQVEVPLVHHDETLGRFVLGRRGQNESFSAADRQLLADLARQAAAALYALRLNVDLQHSRERLVMAREEERRRLRRDLHDGLGPTLAALGLKVETARNRLGHDSSADALLADLAARAQDAVSDIRRLVYGLRPPALDDLGLVGALQQLVASAEPPPRVELTAPEEGFPPLSAAVEVAVYRIAQEAVTNVVRHARATHCKVQVAIRQGALRLSVEDNGEGLPSVVRGGVGLHSMRERAEELGGEFRVEDLRTGGTRVIATLPIEKE
jgi:signal transduction histidine kinase